MSTVTKSVGTIQPIPSSPVPVWKIIMVSRFPSLRPIMSTDPLPLNTYIQE